MMTMKMMTGKPMRTMMLKKMMTVKRMTVLKKSATKVTGRGTRAMIKAKVRKERKVIAMTTLATEARPAVVREWAMINGDL
jgi:hypothetical protein